MGGFENAGGVDVGVCVYVGTGMVFVDEKGPGKCWSLIGAETFGNYIRCAFWAKRVVTSLLP